MYKITTAEGNLITQTDDPRFVMLNPDSGAWVRTDAINAQCIAVNGVRYSLAGREPVEDAPIVAFIQKLDAGAIQAENESKLDRHAEDIDLLAYAFNSMAQELIKRLNFNSED